MSAAAGADTLTLDFRVRYPGFELTLDRSLPLTGVTAVFGPSGGGKTTLLRAVAGLAPAQGRIALGSDALLDSARGIDLPAHRRPVGVTFQDGRLFPHLDVAGNLDFGWRRLPAPVRDEALRREVLQAFDLTALLHRAPGALSGGERQRVALARTLLARPRLLLLDEPLSALDRERKGEIVPYIERLAGEFATPVLYVTHAVDEVARLADRVLVLQAGRATAWGSTGEILERLDIQPLTGRFEAGVVVEGEVTGHDAADGLTHLSLDGQAIVIPAMQPLAVGSRRRLRVLARDVALATVRPDHISIRNVLAGRLLELSETADSPFVEALVVLERQRLRARITRAAVRELALAPGQEVFALLKSVSFD